MSLKHKNNLFIIVNLLTIIICDTVFSQNLKSIVLRSDHIISGYLNNTNAYAVDAFQLNISDEYIVDTVLKGDPVLHNSHFLRIRPDGSLVTSIIDEANNRPEKSIKIYRKTSIFSKPNQKRDLRIKKQTPVPPILQILFLNHDFTLLNVSRPIRKNKRGLSNKLEKILQ